MHEVTVGADTDENYAKDLEFDSTSEEGNNVKYVLAPKFENT